MPHVQVDDPMLAGLKSKSEHSGHTEICTIHLVIEMDVQARFGAKILEYGFHCTAENFQAQFSITEFVS